MERGTGIGARERMTDTIRRQLKNLGLYINRIKGDVLCYLLSLTLLGLELAVDGNVGILVEMGIGLEAGFGLGSAFDHGEIMVEEPNAPFEGFGRMSVLKSMGLALGLLDEFTIRYAGSRPSLGEMVGIELEKAFGVRHSADHDVFFVTAAFFDHIHCSPEGFVEGYRHKIAHASGARCGIGRERDIMVNNASHTQLNACFKVPCHVLISDCICVSYMLSKISMV